MCKLVCNILRGDGLYIGDCVPVPVCIILFHTGSKGLCLTSHFMPDMPYLLILNAETLIPSLSSTALAHLRQSVSLQERITAMEVLTCMFSQILERSDVLDPRTYSMCRQGIQTLAHLEELQRLAGTIARRMDVSLPEDWVDLDQEIQDKLDRKTLKWLYLSGSTTSHRFGNLLENWLLAFFSDHSPRYNPTQSGDLQQLRRNMNILQEFELHQNAYLNYLSGETDTLEDLANQE